MNAYRTLKWDLGEVTIQALGAMIGPAIFTLKDGRKVSPLHIAPWANDAKAQNLPGILRGLRGEWPCVPFGNDTPRELLGDWPNDTGNSTFVQEPHGHASNHDWVFGECTDRSVELICEYPIDHPIERIRRIISAGSGAQIDIVLEIYPRENFTLPIGLHPTFTIQPDCVYQIILDGYQSVYSYPGSVEIGAEIFAPDQNFEKLAHVQTRTGEYIDASKLPLSTKGEDLLQLLNVDGQYIFKNLTENYQTKVRWNASDFPSLLIWYSNFGRQEYPWNGRHLAIGLEPVCSAFDLGPQISGGENPLTSLGHKTANVFCAGEVFSTKYSISVM